MVKKVIKREEPTCNSHSTTILNLDEQEQNSDWIKIAHRKRGGAETFSDSIIILRDHFFSNLPAGFYKFHTSTPSSLSLRNI